jgi:hypothetical protein
MADFTIVKGMVDGQTIATWTQDWWTWALQAPYVTNPLLDTTGAYAGINNNEPVYFVAGTASDFGGPANVDRMFDVPAGKPLLIPVLNSFDTLDPKNVENMDMQAFQNGVRGLFAEIDGVPIRTYNHISLEQISFPWDRPSSAAWPNRSVRHWAWTSRRLI